MTKKQELIKLKASNEAYFLSVDSYKGNMMLF